MQKQHWSKSLLITVLCKKKDGFPRLIVRKLCLSNKSAGNVSFQTCEKNWHLRCRSLHKYLNCTNSSIHRMQLQERNSEKLQFLSFAAHSPPYYHVALCIIPITNFLSARNYFSSAIRLTAT